MQALPVRRRRLGVHSATDPIKVVDGKLSDQIEIGGGVIAPFSYLW
jgi:hypothetical protein